MKFLRLIVIALSMIAISNAALAAQGPALTDRLVQSFIASFADAKGFADKNGLSRMDPPPSRPGTVSNPFAAVIQHLHDKGLYNDFRSVVARYGFSTPEQWVGVAERVMKAYVANSVGDQGAQMDSQMKAALAQVQNDPNITPAQKQMILQQMQQSSAMVKSMTNADPADKAAVSPHMARLKTVFESR